MSTAKPQGLDLNPPFDNKVWFFTQKGYGGDSLGGFDRQGECITLDRPALSVVNDTGLTVRCYKHVSNRELDYCTHRAHLKDVQDEAIPDLTPGVVRFYIDPP